jgi:carboxyl-terminal processing protease
MPRRNLYVIVFAALIAAFCYGRAARNRYSDTFAQAMNFITRDYVDEVEPRVLFEGALRGMMDQLDPYSGYTSPQEYAQFKEQMEGEFPGIGVMIELDEASNQLKVLVPLPGSPAAEAGLLPGDIITGINGEATTDLPLRDAIGRIKGPAGSKVELTIRHPGSSRDVTVMVPRAQIAIESVLGDARRPDGTWVYHLLDDPRIGLIRLDSFGERTADDFRQALESLRRQSPPAEALILDLRGNEGGLLQSAVEVCDMLIDGGTIVSTRGRGGEEKSFFEAKDGTQLDLAIPLVVLVDRYSASAAEIVAACLQDHHRAVVIGERSWGKGTVQNVVDLEGGKSAIRLTIATYWRPSGKDIHKRKNAQESDDWGVRPDEGMSLPLSKSIYEQSVRARRKRDVTPLADLASRPQIELPPQSAVPLENTVPPVSGSSPSAAPPAVTPPAAASDDDDNDAPPGAFPKVDAPDEDAPRELPPKPIPDSEEALPEPAPVDPHFVDPQIQRAIEYLRQELATERSLPRAA